MIYGLCKNPSTQDSECLVVGICNDIGLKNLNQFFDQESQELIARLAQRLDENGDWLWQTESNNRSLMLIQCGKQESFDANNLRKRMSDISEILLKQKISSATLCLPSVMKQNADWQITQMILQMDACCYQLNDFKTKNKKTIALESVYFYLPEGNEESVKAAQAIAIGSNLTRRLADLPANHCTPSYLAEEALSLAQQHTQIKTTVMDTVDMQQMGMGAFLAVAQGSVEPPKFIEINYQGGGNSAPIVLVGKGITFDSGGLSLKPADAMLEMKYDMSGAASVLGTLKACALLQLPQNVIGLIACAENLPSGTAVKPGDIVTSMSGQTIEILNTDAEGRLALADALTYAERFNPEMVLDLATLTGAMVVALGYIKTGFMTHDEELADLINKAAATSNDSVWRMPLDDAYQEALDSPLADMINASFDRSAGAITAACFLSRFAGKYRWAHLDIAGTAWISGKKRQATARPVPLLVQLLRNVANSH